MTITDRIAEVLRREIRSSLGLKSGDYFPSEAFDNAAAALAEDLGLTPEHAVTSGGFREFFPHDTLEEAQRGLAIHLINNEQWARCGDEVPLWARDPQIVTRHVTRWERADG